MHAPALLEARSVSKRFGTVVALENVSFDLRASEVHALLGDNGAGKSTLVKILSGAHAPTSGTLCVDGAEVGFASPRDAQAAGIGTVYQDLALIPLMSVTRNFFLGHEPTVGAGPFRRVHWRRASDIVRSELERSGRAALNVDQPVGTLSGGERQSLAIARAVYHGARALILDEPTSALGVSQTRSVLDQIRTLADEGVGVIVITHNARHAHEVADRFTVLEQGRVRGTFERGALTLDELRDLMAGDATRRTVSPR